MYNAQVERAIDVMNKVKLLLGHNTPSAPHWFINVSIKRKTSVIENDNFVVSILTTNYKDIPDDVYGLFVLPMNGIKIEFEANEKLSEPSCPLPIRKVSDTKNDLIVDRKNEIDTPVDIPIELTDSDIIEII
jgi:hypothetical protein